MPASILGFLRQTCGEITSYEGLADESYLPSTGSVDYYDAVSVYGNC